MMKQLIFRLPSRLMFLVVGLMLSLGAFAQITVNGHVKDATGEDIIGATVRIVGQQGGTVTDFNGNFQLKAKAGAELQISSIGYQTATVKAAAQVEVILQDDAKVLDQVVVIRLLCHTSEKIRKFFLCPIRCIFFDTPFFCLFVNVSITFHYAAWFT